MIRDTLKDIRYFDKYIKQQNVRIEQFSDKLLTCEKAIEDYDKIQKRWLIHLYGLYEDKIYAMYSFGSSKEEILEVYQEMVKTAFKLEELSFSDVILLSSLAILLDARQDNTEFIDNLKKRYDCEDILIQFLFRYLESERRMPVDDCKIEDDEYIELSKLLVAPEIEQLSIFKDFIKNKWYKANENSWWYDTHKNEFETYVGYWSFECAAIAKILGFDIEDIKELPYLPVDLIK